MADNWFISIELAFDLLKRGLTYLGIMKKEKLEVPKELLPSKIKVEKSAVYGFTKDLFLVFFITRKNKTVLLLSSMHHIPSIGKKSGTSKLMKFFNKTKGCVDALDEKYVVHSTGHLAYGFLFSTIKYQSGEFV
ncbi:hypothetical protein HNY73_011040 [Argiope bruennichi]|uniref:PiggyBac transposable element-derived protein domain-containing protein n=1 Tax=Argiope bruennichi TaxID=94029 RepID=A0A8T0F2Y8_ARGBR|nr:hypothetical protein HNY73_011040 [Argiope bruennichi]